MRVTAGDGHRGCDDGPSWGRSRRQWGILGLKRNQEMEEENQAQWPKTEECARVWADSWGSRVGPLRKAASHTDSGTLGLSR